MHCPKNQLIRANHSAPSARPNCFPAPYMLPQLTCRHTAALYPLNYGNKPSIPCLGWGFLGLRGHGQLTDRQQQHHKQSSHGFALSGSSHESANATQHRQMQAKHRHWTLPATSILRKHTPVLGLSAMHPGGTPVCRRYTGRERRNPPTLRREQRK
jgi:hypothetical protein